LEELHKALSSSSEEIWDETLKTNVSSVYFTVAAFVPLLGAAAKRGGGRGSVIITGSSAGFHWDRGFDSLAYQTSKAYVSLTLQGVDDTDHDSGVHHLTTTLAAKLIPHGIRVNAIAPGIFPSQLIDPTDPNNPFVKAIQTVPLKRFGKDTVCLRLRNKLIILGSCWNRPLSRK
jgi:NAD(P)-dependent dehydrogenase (short-subunit alcohol dehydrogenase family)